MSFERITIPRYGMHQASPERKSAMQLLGLHNKAHDKKHSAPNLARQTLFPARHPSQVFALVNLRAVVMDSIPKGDLPLTWALIAKTFLLGVISVVVYRRFFHPLKDIPGPALASISRIWHIYHILKGDQNLQLVDLHEKYGENARALFFFPFFFFFLASQLDS